ncbi:DUF3137 domain-containing protein [Cellulophaga sp. E16_2]|uniref:DUF3137 domain-containing protein n=1 Tax=Cellulophaga sp. E16_2 TaxID=2789297 RepID=UPI001A91F64F|nr:DUF3137 domain-containing protein [Cellulophaga sp. E16_2]MBO0593911.1 DUF3137 domain-containing protein [Cellulophaga sp. E16_2]
MESQQELRIRFFFERVEKSLKNKNYTFKPKQYGCITSLVAILPLLLILIAVVSSILSGITLLLFSTAIFPTTILKYGFYLFIIALIVRHFPKRKYKPDATLQEEFKTDILPRLIKSVYPTISYHQKYKTDNAALKAANFFSKDFWQEEGRLSGEDALKGRYKNVDFELAELTHYIEVLSQRGWFISIFLGLFMFISETLADVIFGILDIFGDKTISKSKQNFRGLFLYADFHKDFEGEIILRTRRKSILEKIIAPTMYLEKVIPENSAVNEKYEVYATSKQLGYYALSPTIIEAIEKITKELQADVSLKLKDGKLYLIIPLEHNFFEIYKVKNNIIKANTKKDILWELQSVKYLIETLNLETRIWSKI